MTRLNWNRSRNEVAVRGREFHPDPTETVFQPWKPTKRQKRRGVRLKMPGRPPRSVAGALKREGR
jgi:hypothetical protein